MDRKDGRLWPFAPWVALALIPIILLALLAWVVIVRSLIGWPTETSEGLVLTGILVLSLIPLFLMVVDSFATRGGKFEFQGLKLDFSGMTAPDGGGVAIPPNIGVPGRPITDTATEEILDTLRAATSADVVIVDLEQGRAWWETRLVVLIAGAMRLGRPEAIVFVATDGGVRGAFQGWGYPHDLLPLLLDANPQYAVSYYRARAAAQQWLQVEPEPVALSPLVANVPAMPATVVHGMGARNWNMAFDRRTGLPNPLALEQALADDLGREIEQAGLVEHVSLQRLETLFRPVLYRTQIDETRLPARQVDAFLDSTAPFVAVTRGGQYVRLLPRITGLNALVKALVERAAGGADVDK